MNAMPSKNDAISRRSFLSWLVKGSLAGSALLGLSALGRYINFQTETSTPRQYDLGLASAYPVGSRTKISLAPAILIHNSQGFTALSLICPHLGCVVNGTSEGYTCPCHGSRFNPDGSLRNGPASGPMSSMRVEINEEGHLILYTD